MLKASFIYANVSNQKFPLPNIFLGLFFYERLNNFHVQNKIKGKIIILYVIKIMNKLFLQFNKKITSKLFSH